MEDFDPNAVPETAEQAEALVQHWSSPGATEEEVPAPEIQEKTPEENLFEINYRGKLEKHPLDKVLQFANQGRDYNEKMRDFRVQRDLLEKERKEWQTQLQTERQLFDEYRQWKDLANKEPGWLEALRNSYLQRSQEQAVAGTPQDPLIQTLASRVEELSGFVTSQKEREAIQARAQEDEALDLEIREYRDKYPTFEWDKVDDQGQSLEKRILNHAIEHNIQSFRAAANDFLLDEHLKRAQGSAKENVGKQIQKATKLGLGPVTKTPTLKLKSVENVASKTWEDVYREALEATGIA